ncbi:hypothetical protein [Thetidibacter halocola]|uniref:Uncharacterized protein n=1 Tax=Thetidibacter halocola TaxID=2827239 RepID=A0A8J7WDY2_9RHOB|nr:hypothetical protein [Thetidibacter halocola]MBS0123429.1 hypothetical protein [Thetidibacter halocola]
MSPFLGSSRFVILIVVLGVLLLAQAVTRDGQRDLMGLGIGIVAPTWFLDAKAGKDK